MRTSLEFAGKNEYPISNKEYPTDEGKAKKKRQSYRFLTTRSFHDRYCRKKAGATAIFLNLDIGYSLLDIGYSNYLVVKNEYGYSSGKRPTNSGGK